jgi:hypothetical protein
MLDGFLCVSYSHWNVFFAYGSERAWMHGFGAENRHFRGFMVAELG